MNRRRPLQRDAEIEDLLWLRLKTLRERGWHFRKGATFKTFSLPFAEHAALLVVELDDGGRHAVRDRLLAEAGYTVLRFPRAEAEADPTGVIDRVVAVLKDRET